MYEHFAPLWGSPPHSGILALYARWAAGDWGMVITGNVQVAKDHLPLGRDMIVPDVLTDETLAPWRALANVMHFGSPEPPAPADAKDLGKTPLAIVQISHGGRQTMNFFSGRPLFAPPLAPSAVPVGASHKGKEGWLSAFVHSLMLQVPKEMSLTDIHRAVGQFVHGAQMAARGGFDGVEVHAAHGYLISQFISPKSNRRTDEYSAERDPLHFLRDVVFAIRAPGVVPNDFVVGVKLNSADYVGDGSTKENRALEHVREIGEWGLVDFIEVSGGDYEDPQFIDTVENFKSPRQVIFESFAEKSMSILSNTATNRPPPVVVLTGGLNTLPRMTSVLAHDHAHLLGIARLSVLHPELPKELSSAIKSGTPAFMSDPPSVSELGQRPRSLLSVRAVERLLCYILILVWSVVPASIPRIIGASASVNWYNIMLRRIARGQDIDYTMGTIGATLRCYLGGTPYAPQESGEGWTWWAAVAMVGVVLGIGLGQVV
ncbi:FMN-linked oxidoreductase [Lentinus brumalis]|uniref:FMN-linked oxidoreductase n=1 Tax=Lentinus brumalis TaxID=2498619 RepID=A0A371CQJ3_9APHY|nr:FMN-linked oxidoreductase [Polyporus brumalis]